MKDAQGHGSNTRGYRGKYPTKINTVYGMKGQNNSTKHITHALVVTNDGQKFDIPPAGGKMPKPGQDISEHQTLPAYSYQPNTLVGKMQAKLVDDVAAGRMLASGTPKSVTVPTHDGMKMSGVGPNDPRVGSRDYDAFGRPREDKSSYDEYSRDLQYRGRQGNGGIGSGGR